MPGSSLRSSARSAENAVARCPPWRYAIRPPTSRPSWSATQKRPYGVPRTPPPPAHEPLLHGEREVLALGGRAHEFAERLEMLARRILDDRRAGGLGRADALARALAEPSVDGGLVVTRLEREDEPVSRGLNLLGFGEPAGGERRLVAGIRIELGIHGEDRSARRLAPSRPTRRPWPQPRPVDRPQRSGRAAHTRQTRGAAAAGGSARVPRGRRRR